MANTTYCVKISDYYRGLDPAVGGQDSIAGNDNTAMCEAAIRQLVDRYELAGKDTLSIGAGRAVEEYWMGKAGRRLRPSTADTPMHRSRPMSSRYSRGPERKS